jgi:tRNA (cmo5U34)-methyltransferase
MADDDRFAIPQNWTFETDDVARGFERHVREQLPWYEIATGAVAHIARHYVPEDGVVLDLGASTGNIGRALAPTLEVRNARLIAVERAESMRAQYRGPGEFVAEDLRKYQPPPCDLAIAFLCLMFLPLMDRRTLIARLREALRPGGAIILFDRMEALSGYPATILSRLTLAGKMASGVDPREIVEKELSLMGVQRPLRRAELPDEAVEVFRFGEFAGWLIEREAP